jgi:anaerobic selenocysteine-containing dehydrogenase
MDDTRVTYRTCPLCEATCGLELTMRGEEVVRIRGDRDDVFSRGFICPKGTTLGKLDSDPDRVRTPLVKRDGELVPATWDEAFAEIDRRLTSIVAEHGRRAVAVYLGNPSAHSLSAQLYGGVFVKALGTPNVFSASTVDQMPKQVSAGLMFGTALSIPVPDLDRTAYLLILGANPYESNGSLMTAPDAPGRLSAIRERGGKVVVVDPRRTKTAEAADEHVAVRPGTDAFLLFGLVSALFEADLVAVDRYGELVDGLDDVRALAAAFAPDAVAPVCGVEAATIRRLARELATAPSAAVYGRIGTTTTEFGTVASWLVDVVNLLTGNLDRPGGAMFTKAVAGSANSRGTPGSGRGIRLGRRSSRVRGAPEVFGEFPAAALAEEIETPGDGQVRALFTIAGNPVLSTPNGGRLDAALNALDLMVCVDVYVNETTRHADVVLPANRILTRAHYDLALYQLAIRNVANYTPPTLPLAPGELDESEILLRLAAIAGGQGAGADPAALDDLVALDLATKAAGPLGTTPEALFESVSAGGRRGPARLVDLMVRSGPYDGITLDALVAAPHGLDMGPLEPRLPDVLRTPSGRIELAPPEIVADVARLRDRLASVSAADAEPGELVLVGRRDLRSNNSWMHNVDVLVKGKPRCTLHVHPADAERLGLVDGGSAKVASRVGVLEAPVEVTDAIARGVVSLPHGWGHDLPGVSLSVAGRHAGVNTNLLTDEDVLDPLSGTARLNGIPVSVTPG